MGKLVLHLPDGSTRDIPLARERMTIGRRADNDICLPLPTVSAEHAAVVTVLDDSFLEDLGSRNGTLVNGRTIKKHFLRDHDEIDVGRQRLVYFGGPLDDAPAPVREVAVEPAGPDVPPPVAARTVATTPRELIDTAALFADPGPPPPAAAPPPDAPTLEVLDGPVAGWTVPVERDDFVLGRVGVALAAIRRTPDGWRLAHLEGEARPELNGATLPADGALLSLGDELRVAGTRLRFRPAVAAAGAADGPRGA